MLKKTFDIPFKKFICFALVLVLFMCACDRQPVYSGENKPLAAAAIYSIPGTTSDIMDTFLILEQDDFGRTLFAASLATSWLSSSSDLSYPAVLAILVVQRFNENYVYFYGEENYIYKTFSTRQTLSNEILTSNFSDSEIESLKVANDWGKPCENNMRAFVKAPIQTEKDNACPSSAREFLEKEIGTNIRLEPFREDSNGRKAYFVLHIVQDPVATETQYEWYLVIFNSDWELEDSKRSILYIQDPSSMAAEVSSFFLTHNWIDIN